MLAVPSAADPVVFSLDVAGFEHKPRTVAVAGDFNAWSADADPMAPDGGAPNRWSATVDLPPGLTRYKFVIDGSRWIADPTAERGEPDGQGGTNSVVLVGGEAALAASTHRFELDARGWDDKPLTVNLAGAFNGWSKTHTPMQEVAPGVFEVSVALPDGIHPYKFVVDGDRWVNDEKHSDESLEESDGNGGVNSAVLIGFDARALPAPKPDHLSVEAMSHRSGDFLHLSVASPGLVLLGVDTQAGDAERVRVHTRTGGGDWSTHELAKQQTKLGLTTFGGLVRLGGPADAGDAREDLELSYVFEAVDGDARAFLGAGGVAGGLDAAEPFATELTPGFQTPEWAKDAVWYQVFVERFRNGNPANDPGAYPYENLLPWTSDWWETHTAFGEAAGEENFYEGAGNVWARRYGGDIQGLQEALPYLKELGITALYLNPIFEADSMHKYDTADFRHVDDNFGILAEKRFEQVAGETDDPATWKITPSDRVFLDFLEVAHAQGFKVVIDGVFNHTGTAHPFFQDVLMHGPESEYADWFEVTDWGDPANWGKPEMAGEPGGIQYNAWDGPSGALPVFKNDPQTGLAPGPREHIFAITKRWLDPDGDGDPSDGVDGWRLDVPGDIAHPFWIDWRKVVKDVNPDAYIVGEIWPWAHPWLQGDQFDAVMNYQFAMPATDFFADVENPMPPSVFAERMLRVAYGYPMQVALAQQNLYGSHDTDRLASMFVNTDRPYDGMNRIQDSDPSYDKRKPDAEEWARMRQAVVFQHAFLGAPMTYYGDEAGMWGPDDPSNRAPMVWPDAGTFEQEGVGFDPEMYAFFRRVIAIRQHLPALQRGAFNVVLADDDAGVFAFERVLGDERVVVVHNRSGRARDVEVPVDAERVLDLLDPATASVPAPDLADPQRPELEVRGDGPVLRASGGEATVRLPAWGSAILVAP
ncbi:putative glucosidase [Phycisphaera mikurensis NBRC 102666]|uniref:Putative glucosidase n=1 Tax=Phycisphaera mikurensis (strain NBRC 102666 / KCTC 22515 / FYK2301M01) TaxID=1142394 RepID=I0IFM5_PHYMF|nr:putative glucosidase [Phycisphaera mikurensis NBRC 102666]